MRLLVVEDEKKVASFIKKGLEEEGYVVDLAYDGESGLELALEKVHDLIVLDVHLPKKNGLRLLQELRAEKVNTPVLLLTVRAAIEDKVLGLDSGADDYSQSLSPSRSWWREFGPFSGAKQRARGRFFGSPISPSTRPAGLCIAVTNRSSSPQGNTPSSITSCATRVACSPEP